VIFDDAAIILDLKHYLAVTMKNMMLTVHRIAKGLALGCMLMLGATCHGQRLSTGYNFSFRICPDSSAMAWGQNEESQLDTSAILNAEVPINVALDSLTAIDGGAAHTIALRADSTVWAWGENAEGQLGLGDTLNHQTPEQISPATLSGVVAISAGANHSMALRSDSTVWVWGMNNKGQVGDTSTTKRDQPKRIFGPTGIVAIAAGGYFSLALGADGRVWAWGSDDFGQVGDGNPTLDKNTPVLIGIDSVIAISASEFHVLALRQNGRIRAWGRNNYGQLGISNAFDQSSPIDVLVGPGIVTALAAGSGHSLILDQSGAVWATGNNASGQLGLGDTQNRSTFDSISGGFLASAIACGEIHSLAMLPSGACVGWGSNSNGQVGNGTQVNQTSPTPIIGLCPTDFAVPDPVFTNYFRPEAAPDTWIAGELSSSVRLLDGRMLWLFGRSYLDSLDANNGIPCNRTEIANCVLVQDSLNPDSFTTHLNPIAGQPNRAYFQPEPGISYFVPGHGYQDHADTATVFLSGYGVDSVFLGTYTARIGIVTMTVLDISRAIPNDSTIDFGTAVIADTSADQLYVYGSREDSPDTIFPYLSRRKLSDTAATWEFATLNGWDTLIANAHPISQIPVSARYSVISLQGHQYLITENPEPRTVQCRLQRNVLAYKSDSLKGPFVVSSFLATSQDSIAGFPVFAFDAYTHPDQHALGFSRCDSLLVSYNVRDDFMTGDCAAQCATPGSQEADTWRPKFLRVPYSLIDTALKTATVADFEVRQEGTNWIFTNTSQFATTFTWTFGTGPADTLPHPPPIPAVGTLNVTLMASGCGAPDQTTLNIVQQESPTLVAPRFTIYPQPSQGLIHIQGEDLARGPVTLELHTLLGEVMAREATTSINGHVDAVVRYDAPAGMYLLRIATPQSSAYFRIVRQ
jgi:alpha-tubulin suppressor-like RCC1 family protein